MCFRLLCMTLLLYFTKAMSSDEKSSQPFCKITLKTDFRSCGNNTVRNNLRESLFAATITSPNDTKANNYNIGGDCANEFSCRKIIKIGRIFRQSLRKQIGIELLNMLRRCCGNCSYYLLTDLDPPLEDVDERILSKLEIVYPIYAPKHATMVHGFYFEPMLNLPTGIYVTLQKTDTQILTDILNGVLDMWQFLVICILFALIAGFFIWIIETWNNKEEFPRSFLSGFEEGFWWSFISMTTVGYGDKVPKSIIGRTFSMIWIIAGITISSIYIGSIASSVLAAQAPLPQDMSGEQIGALKNRIYDSAMISQHGGILHEIDFNNTADGIAELIELLKEGTIDGFLVSRTTYYYFSSMVNKGRLFRYKEIMKHLTQTEKAFINSDLVAGILFRHYEDHRYYKEYMRSNHPQIQSCYSFQLNKRGQKVLNEKMNPYRALFYPFFWACLVFIGIICCFGAFYEYFKLGKRDEKYYAKEVVPLQ